MSRNTNKISLPSQWIKLGGITVQSSDLGVTGRDAATVEAIASTTAVRFSPPVPGPYAVLIRFRSDGSENDDSVVQLYGASGNDHYHKLAQLTVVQGKQLYSGSIYFVDTITPASEDALYDGEESNIADSIAQYYMRILGCDRFAIICSDLDTTTIYTDIKWLYE
jgi:hypothetical protein